MLRILDLRYEIEKILIYLSSLQVEKYQELNLPSRKLISYDLDEISKRPREIEDSSIISPRTTLQQKLK